MTSFDYLGTDSARHRRVRRFFSTCAPDGMVGLCFACAIILCATWVLEAERFHRALGREEALSQAVARNRSEDARIARRYDRANAIHLQIRGIDEAVSSGAEEARRLVNLVDALPRKTWLTALSKNAGEYQLEGESSDLTELGRALGAVVDLPRVRDATLVEASAFPQRQMPDALRYRIRLVGNPP